MTRRGMYPWFRLAAVTAALLWPPAAAADIGAGRQRALRQLLQQDCGSCHGLTLQGGLGPALTPEALADKSAVVLRAVILDGRPGTPMPPWKPFLSEAEAGWLVEQLQTGQAGVADAR